MFDEMNKCLQLKLPALYGCIHMDLRIDSRHQMSDESQTTPDDALLSLQSCHRIVGYG